MADLKFTSDMTVEAVQQMGGDHMIVHAARVSTRGNWCREDVDDADQGYGLIRYLMKHRHGTPFEHSSITFFVHAPIFVWREWHRHRIGFAYSDYGLDDGGLGQSFNEESGRYKQLDPVFYLPPRDRPMMKVDGWKPGRPKFLRCDDEQTYQCVAENLKTAYAFAYHNYQCNLDLGIDPGLARACLPVGIYSSCWVTCNPRSLMAFLSLRTHDESAQFVSYPLYEIEEAARACEKVFAAGWPLTHRAFVECGRVAP
jgi:thymidylate synthase (FAD)